MVFFDRIVGILIAYSGEGLMNIREDFRISVAMPGADETIVVVIERCLP
jgi:hypothetical protein